MPKPCPSDKILNPKTNRCVKRNGKIGQKLVKRSPNKSPNKSPKKCPEGKILNPATNRCVSKTGAIGRRLLKQKSPKKSPKKSPPAIFLSKNAPGWTSLQGFLSKKGAGEYREKSLKGKYFKGYHYRHFFAELLIYLIEVKKHPVISKIACIPDYYYCIYKNGDSVISVKKNRGDLCEENVTVNGKLYKLTDEEVYDRVSYQKRALIVFYNAPTTKRSGLKTKPENQMFISIPPDFATYVNKCRRSGKKLMINYLSLSTENNQNGHANTIIVNLEKKTIERFDPHGSIPNSFYDSVYIDNILERKFRKILPGYTYINLSNICPLFGPQIKAAYHVGLCITWVTMYALLRLLNYNMDASKIIHTMLNGDKNELLDITLRFRMYIFETIAKLDKTILE